MTVELTRGSGAGSGAQLVLREEGKSHFTMPALPLTDGRVLLPVPVPDFIYLFIRLF